MELLLIRHGESYRNSLENYNHKKRCPDPVLTEKGKRQAEQLASKLIDKGIEAIYCSDLSRAVETADIINNTIKCGVTMDGAFREINMGDVHILSWNGFPEAFAKWKLHEEDLNYPNGECGADVWNRCNGSFQHIVKKHSSRVAIVSHGGTIRAMICGILGIPQTKRFYLGAPIECCSVSVIRYIEAEKKFFLHALNVNEDIF